MTRPLDKILARVEHKQIGPSTYSAFATTRDERTASVRIKELEDGRVLIHDFGGADTSDFLAAIGLSLADLFPPSAHLPVRHAVRPVRRPFLPADVFEAARIEVGVVAVIASDMHAGRTISPEDFDRLLSASARLSRIAGAAYAR